MDNKNARDKSDGEILLDIAREFRRYLTLHPTAILVREKALDVQAGPHKSRTIEVLHKVIGCIDLYAYALVGQQFMEVFPKTIKKRLTNNGDAEKDVVARSLVPYVGEIDYACDDESDAVAVGLAWMMDEEQGWIDPPVFPKEKKVAAK